jgi:hypothetical protein
MFVKVAWQRREKLSAARCALQRVSNRHEVSKAYGFSSSRRAENLEDLRGVKRIFEEIADQEVAAEHARKLAGGADAALITAVTPVAKRHAIEDAVTSIIANIRRAAGRG